jgi:hypothetical protein
MGSCDVQHNLMKASGSDDNVLFQVMTCQDSAIGAPALDSRSMVALLARPQGPSFWGLDLVRVTCFFFFSMSSMLICPRSPPVDVSLSFSVSPPSPGFFVSWPSLSVPHCGGPLKIFPGLTGQACCETVPSLAGQIVDGLGHAH